MSAAARGAAGYLYASGKLRGPHGEEARAEIRRQREVDRIAEELKQARETYQQRAGARKRR